MNHHQFRRGVAEIQIMLLAAMIILMGAAVLLTLVVVLLRWAGVPC
jgi:hypothetical protein